MQNVLCSAVMVLLGVLHLIMLLYSNQYGIKKRHTSISDKVASDKAMIRSKMLGIH